MPKRYTDTDKWKKSFINPYKLKTINKSINISR